MTAHQTRIVFTFLAIVLFLVLRSSYRRYIGIGLPPLQRSEDPPMTPRQLFTALSQYTRRRQEMPLAIAMGNGELVTIHMVGVMQDAQGREVCVVHPSERLYRSVEPEQHTQNVVPFRR